MGSCGGGGGYSAWLEGGNWSRKAGMYISSTPWKPLAPSSARISGPSPHTTKYSKIRDDDPISGTGTGYHRPPDRDARRACGRLPLSMVSALCALEGGGQAEDEAKMVVAVREEGDKAPRVGWSSVPLTR